jgi:hypothetical protein
MLHDKPPEERSQGGVDPHETYNHARVFASLAQREKVADDGFGEDEDAATTDPLEEAARDEGLHVRGSSRNAAADGEHGSARDDGPSAAVDVGHLPEEWLEDGSRPLLMLTVVGGVVRTGSDSSH